MHRHSQGIAVLVQALLLWIILWQCWN